MAGEKRKSCSGHQQLYCCCSQPAFSFLSWVCSESHLIGVWGTSQFHILKPNPHTLSLSDSTYLFSSEVFNEDKRDPYLEHNKLPQAPSQDLCPYVLNRCCPLRNASGSQIVVVAPQPGSQHLRLWLFNTAPVPFQTRTLPAGGAQPARVKQE